MHQAPLLEGPKSLPQQCKGMVLKARGERVKTRSQTDLSVGVVSYVELTIGEEQGTLVSCVRRSIGAEIRVRQPIFCIVEVYPCQGESFKASRKNHIA